MLLKPTSDKISEIQSFRESNRRSNFFNHLSAVSESIPALGWVAVVRRRLYVTDSPEIQIREPELPVFGEMERVIFGV